MGSVHISQDNEATIMIPKMRPNIFTPKTAGVTGTHFSNPEMKGYIKHGATKCCRTQESIEITKKWKLLHKSERKLYFLPYNFQPIRLN